MIFDKFFVQKVRVCQHVLTQDRPPELLVNWYGNLICACNKGDHKYEDEFSEIPLKKLSISLKEKKILKSLQKDQSAIWDGKEWILGERNFAICCSEEEQEIWDEVHQSIRDNGGFWVYGDGSNIGYMTGNDGTGIMPIWLEKPQSHGVINDTIFNNKNYFLTIKNFETEHRETLFENWYVVAIYHNGEFPTQYGYENKFMIPIANFLPKDNAQCTPRFI